MKRADGETATGRVRRAYARIEEVDRPEVWITLRPAADALADAARIDARVAAGDELSLAGLVVAVKDNIDVAALPTTAGCPAFAYHPEHDAYSVAQLVAAGAIVLGKTNLDQFATGLVGTRSPYGAVRDSRRPDRISGGSSSGSAVAVALGIADLGLATDTAGSGRVPAALQGIVGVKLTRGLVSVGGVVPACRDLDCVSVFARDLPLALRAAKTLAAPDPADSYSRSWPPHAPLGAPARPRVAVARAADLADLSPAAHAAYEAAAHRIESQGGVLVETDIAPLLAVSAMLYEGSFVAARYAAVGAFIDEHPADVDPVVAAVIQGARTVAGYELVADQDRLAAFAKVAAQIFGEVDALVLPTVSGHPLLREVDAEPVAVNAALGRYTHFCNLLDLCAIAVPAGDADGGPFGVTIFGPPFHDRLVADVAGLVLGERIGEQAPAPSGIPLAVFGAHLTGQPLNSQLVGARLEREITTAPGYGLYALDTEPPKPGLLRVEHQPGAITGELWRLPPTTLAALLADLPSPMTLGQVELADGSSAVGFLCESAATVGSENITGYGSWASYLRRHSSSANGLTSANVLADVVEDDRTELGGTFEMDGVGSVGD